MAQHLWQEKSHLRLCDMCGAYQVKLDTDWSPAMRRVCPGDDDDGGVRRGGCPPTGPPGARQVLEDAA